MNSKPEDKIIHLSVLLIVLLGIAVYNNSLNGSFLYDDEILIERNEYIKNWSDITKIFKSDIGTSDGKKYGFYRPVQMLTYAIDHSLWILNERGYHLTNVLLHIAVGLTIFWLVTILYGDQLLSLFTSLFFIIHPIHTEAVSYISCRSELLYGLFLLLSFIFYIKYSKNKKFSFYSLMVLSYVSALLSRESSIILPLFLLLYHYAFKKNIKIKAFLTVSVFSLGYILLRFTLLKFLQLDLPSTFLQRLPGFFAALAEYVKLLFLPLNLHMEYGERLFYLTCPQVISGFFVFLFLLTTAAAQRKDNLVLFPIFWFFIAILPYSNLYPINAYMAEHWLYLPSIGFFLILAKFLRRLYDIKKLKVVFTICLISLAVFYSLLTVRQNDYWKGPVDFYERTLKYAPNNARIYNNLGRIYNLKFGESEKAINALKKAVELDPNYAFAYCNLGDAYASTGKTAEAEALYIKAMELDPTYVDPYINLGIMYRKLGKNEEAIILFKKTLEIRPGFFKAYNNIGAAYDDMGRYEDAVAMYKKAIERYPNNSEVYCNLGFSYRKLGKYEEAVVMFKNAIEIDPNSVRAYNGLAKVYLDKGEYKAAVKYFIKTKDLGYIDCELLKALKSYIEKHRNE